MSFDLLMLSQHPSINKRDDYITDINGPDLEM